VQTNNKFPSLLSEMNRVCGRVVRTLIEYDAHATRSLVSGVLVYTWCPRSRAL